MHHSIGYIRTKGFISNNNNYNNDHLLNERFEINKTLSPCTCSSILPSSYGFKQSSLIHWSIYNSNIFGVAANRSFRIPVARGTERACYKGSYYYSRICSGRSCGGGNGSGCNGNRRNMRVVCNVKDEGNESSCELSEDDEGDGVCTTEIMLSLLSEERSVSRRVQVERGRRGFNGERDSRSDKFEKRRSLGWEKEGLRSGGEKFGSGVVRVEKRGGGFSEKRRTEEKNSGSDYFERNSGSNGKFDTVKTRKDVKGNSSSLLRKDVRGSSSSLLKKNGSNCSSYYSAFSSNHLMEIDAERESREGRNFNESLSEREELRRKDERDIERASNYVEGVEGTDIGQGSINELRMETISNSRINSSQNMSDVLDIHDSGHEETFDSQKRFSRREGNSTSSSNVNEKAWKQSQQASSQAVYVSETQGDNTEKASKSKYLGSQSEDSRSSYANSVQEARKSCSQINQQTSEENTRKEQITRLSTAQPSEVRNLAIQSYSDDRKKNREDHSASVQEACERHSETYKQYLRTESVCTEVVSQSHESYKTRMNVRDKTSTSVVDYTQESRRGHDCITEQPIKEVGSKKELRSPMQLSTLKERFTKAVSSSQTSINLIHQDSSDKEIRSDVQVMVSPPSAQMLRRGSSQTIHYNRPFESYSTQELSGESSKSSLRKSCYLEGRDDDVSGIRRDEVYNEYSEVFQEDAMGSVNRLQQSSTHFVGEFEEKLRHAVSTSDLKGRISAENNSEYKDYLIAKQGPVQQVSDNFKSQGHGLSSSSRSGRRGPSHEMWDVFGPSPHEPSKTKAPTEINSTSEEVQTTNEVTSIEESAIVKRSSRTLWGVVADLVRMRWGARPETHHSFEQSGDIISSAESVGSEAWFSGQETDIKDEETVKKDRRVQVKSLPRKSQIKRKDETFEVSEIQEDIKSGTDIPSSTLNTNSPLILPSRRLLRSHSVNEESESSRSGYRKLDEHNILESPNTVLEREENVGKLTQRKIRRNKQVLRESFEEWEEAYRLENEQRKVDEIFMREALLEAKKAATTWEVPVGAVLVQHGKIIARGCNLVEQLRDSTAHAEMICIREASSLLHTWRLADTTLYVTLEPCAMCAGAILQARVDTIVWGAPNKLLGADGSWVRLFPGGSEEGIGSSDVVNHGLGPVHPFHPKISIRRGILATECADVMQQFFQLRRKKTKKQDSPLPPCLPISANPAKLLSKMQNIFSFMFCL